MEEQQATRKNACCMISSHGEAWGMMEEAFVLDPSPLGGAAIQGKMQGRSLEQ
jgi:hypothetical protein